MPFASIICELRTPISKTRPRILPTSTTSPGLKGRSNSSISPLIRFLSIFCIPNPAPIANAPPIKANIVKGILTTNMLNTTRIKTSRNSIQRQAIRARLGSIPNRVTANPSIKRAKRTAIQIPTIRMAKAVTTLSTVMLRLPLIGCPSTTRVSSAAKSSNAQICEAKSRVASHASSR